MSIKGGKTMKTNLYIKFPCGYEYEMMAQIAFPLWVTIKIDDKTLPICPLHGIKCKRDIR